MSARYYVTLDDGTRLHKAAAIDRLCGDGNLSVPCSRYGRRSRDVAEYAWAAFRAYVRANGDDSWDCLDFLMGLAVNDHDDVAYLIRNH